MLQLCCGVLLSHQKDRLRCPDQASRRVKEARRRLLCDGVYVMHWRGRPIQTETRPAVASGWGKGAGCPCTGLRGLLRGDGMLHVLTGAGLCECRRWLSSLDGTLETWAFHQLFLTPSTIYMVTCEVSPSYVPAWGWMPGTETYASASFSPACGGTNEWMDRYTHPIR